MARIDYYTTYAHLYDRFYSGPQGDLAFYQELVEDIDGLIVEVGVGTGRIAIPLALQGKQVVGLDASHEMLTLARGKAIEAGVTNRLGLVQCEMARFGLRRPGVGVLLTACTFLYNLTTDAQLATLRCCYEALLPGGLAAIHLFNPDLALIAEGLNQDGEWHPMSHPWSAYQSRYWPMQQLTTTRYRRETPGGRAEYAEFTLRWVYRHEMEHLLVRSGFEVRDVYGDFDGSRLTEDSPSQIWIAQRRGA
ncbi:MAG: methyltransferase domain-containing protein [Dehalococcoidia bacterium]|nr:methyltransferase domain-containing protein [Dehalococcoidia bacterium]